VQHQPGHENGLQTRSERKVNAELHDGRRRSGTAAGGYLPTFQRGISDCSAGINPVRYWIQPGGGSCPPIVFTAEWASTPTAVVSIYGSNKAPAAAYNASDWTPSALGTISTQSGYYADAGGFAFYLAVLTSQSAGGAVTVLVKR